jgi:hypothetical protein
MCAYIARYLLLPLVARTKNVMFGQVSILMLIDGGGIGYYNLVYH